MVIRRIKQIISTNIYLKILFYACVIVVVSFYFKVFFTTGVYFDDTFLKKEVENSESHYIGKSIYGDISIIVKGLKNKQNSAKVIYRLPNDINMQYTVSFENTSNRNLSIVSVKDEKGNIIFEGKYNKDSPFLIDNNGEPLMDYGQIIVSGENPYNEDYTIPIKNVVDMATFSNDTIRGRYDYLILAAILFIFTAIDIKFPLFFFNLRHFLSVRDPEPSDFYIAMQRIGWYVYPAIGIVLMIAAIC